MEETSNAARLPSAPISAFVCFPSPYTQTLLIKALVSTLPAVSITLLPPSDEDPPQLQWADYDLLSLDVPHANPRTHLISSYIYRKALIRKHQLHLTITEYLAKCAHRGVRSVLAPLELRGDVLGSGPSGGAGEVWSGGGVPRGWVVDVQFADELDELLMDDLYELAEGMQENEGRSDGEKQWYILKPGFADRAQGIRMFSTEDELRAIFESFEPPSSDEEDEDEDEDDDESDDDEEKPRDDEESGAPSGSRDADSLGEDFSRLSSGEAGDDGDNDEEEGGTGIMTSQLRHFVIQEYVPRPMLFNIAQQPQEAVPSSSGNKFHLRAYVLLSGSYTLYLSRVLLALFSADTYTHPTSTRGNDADDDVDIDAALRPHLTNTCLQTDAYGAPIREEGLVKLFWELEGLSALRLGETRAENGTFVAEEQARIQRDWLERTFEKVGEVVSEAVKAGVECGSFGLQLMPNAFEIFGVDLLLSYPPSKPTADIALPEPIVTLLEFNASPDFHQSGDRLRGELEGMFAGVVRGVVAPFFGVEVNEDRAAEDVDVDEHGKGGASAGAAEREARGMGGWVKIGEGAVRGPTV